MSLKHRRDGVHPSWLGYDSVWSTKKLRRRARRKVQRQGDQQALEESADDVCTCGREDCCCADYEE